MTGLLLTGGDAPDKINKIKKYTDCADIICAADSGIYLAERYHLKPDFIVGDMDSVKNADDIRKHGYAEITEYCRDKDYTDTELGFQLLRDKGCGTVVLVGGGGGRIDHLLAIYSMFFRETHPDVWLTENEEIVSVDSEISFDSEAGEEISFFPVSCSETRMESRGLKWELNKLVWRPGDAGISNRAAGSSVHVKIITGRLVMIRSLGQRTFYG